MTSRSNNDEFEPLTFWSNKDEFKLIGSFRGVYVTLQPNKDAFEPTGGLNVSVSGMTFVGSCPTLLVEGDVH